MIVLSGKCVMSDMRVYNASRFLLKPGEHTWGLPNVGDNGNWTNADFMKVRKGMYMYTVVIQDESYA